MIRRCRGESRSVVMGIGFGVALLGLPQVKANEPAQTLDEVIVTATRRSETVRDVPFNIQAISAATLEKTGATGIADFGRTIPGLSFTDLGPDTGVKLVLRGLRTGSEAQLAPTTTVYVDDIPVDMPYRQTPLDLKLVDIERVEVLRGPQGTLFGGGAIGGTLRYISKKPDLRGVEGRATTELSTTRNGGLNYDATGMVNLPVNDWIAVRGSLGYFDNDGFIDNIRLGTRKINDDKTLSGHMVMLMKPVEDLDITVTYHRQDARYGESSLQRESQPSLTVNYVHPGFTRYTAQLANLTLAYNFGWANLTSSSSYVDELHTSADDSTFSVRDTIFGSFLDPAVNPELTTMTQRWAKSHGFTQEVRLVSRAGEPFEWIAGGYYNTVRVHENEQEVVFTPFPGQADFEQNILGAQLNDNKEYTYSTDQRTRQLAAFGEAKYHLTNAWQASVGGRYFRVRGVGNFYSIDQFFGQNARDANGLARTVPTANEISVGSYRENGSVWRFNSSYQLGQAGLVYTTIAQGFRPGGFNLTTPNTGIPPSGRQFKSDSLVSYELGGKFSLLQNRIYVSSALFRINWSDIQTTVATPLGFTYLGNAGKAVSQGLELEVNARDIAVPGLSFNLGYALTDAKLTQTISGIGFEGERTPLVPRHTLSMMADYDVRINSGVKAGLTWLTTYTGGSYADFGPYKPVTDATSGSITPDAVTNHRYLALDSYWLTDLSLRLEGAMWVARVFANNLFDESFKTSRSYYAANSRFAGPDVIYYANRPRTIGLEVTRRF